ncbi:hypothetical protein CTI12_AA524310 [Artemisia annua]|uniref:Uncharacterized protein n=1 Tax=Artemisia annua TaxID=35608 RepID=A0A2U1L6T3_ARTAN|nr:hypothetical protein CTI12_AA524310 [Artemisia annua]
MKIFKNRLRNKMSDENLANSMVIYIEKEIADKFDSESIIEEFKGLKGTSERAAVRWVHESDEVALTTEPCLSVGANWMKNGVRYRESLLSFQDQKKEQCRITKHDKERIARLSKTVAMARRPDKKD